VNFDSCQTITQAHDSLQLVQKPLKSTPSWEKIVSFPINAATFPLILFFKGIEEMLGWYESSESARFLRNLLTPKISIRGVLPAYSRRSGIGFKYYDNNFFYPQTKLALSIKAGLDSRQKYQLEVQHLPLFRQLIHLDFSLMYRLLTIESFYGLGPFSRTVDRTSFSHQYTSADFAIGSDLNSNMTVNLLLGVNYNNILRGKDNDYPSITEIYSENTLHGLEKYLGFGWLGLSISLDSRNQKELTTAGWEGQSSFVVYEQLNFDQFRFWKMIADFRRYIHLFHKRTLVLRLATELTGALQNKQIPFFNLSELGRHETIRGFNRGRFRDKDMILGSLEYRYPIWRSLSVMLFFDTGQVSSKILEDFTLQKLRFGYGPGLRFQTRDKLLLKMEFGFSEDGFRLYLNVNN
jgi:outer membrane protein assembly factor BamA